MGRNTTAAKAGETRVCRTHEYTLSILKLAHVVEPGNLQLIYYDGRRKELRTQGLPAGHDAATAPYGVSVIATLRQWKNGFR